MVITLFTEDYSSVIIFIFFRVMLGLSIDYSSLLCKHVTCNIEHR